MAERIGQVCSDLRKIKVTPATAKAWMEEAILAGKPNPRGNSLQSTIEKYARDMENGNWTPYAGTHFAFDMEGVFRNGWTRSSAVVLSGVEIEVYAAFNQTEEQIREIDRGVSRPLIATLRNHSGVNLPRKAATIVRYIPFLPYGPFRGLTNVESQLILDLCMPSVVFAVEVCRKTALRGPVPALIARAHLCGTHPDERLREFCAVLETGVCDSKSDSAAVLLRNILLFDVSREDKRIPLMYQKAQAALVRFLAGDGSAKQLQPARIDHFPIPKEIMKEFRAWKFV